MGATGASVSGYPVGKGRKEWGRPFGHLATRICEEVHGPCPDGMECSHICGDKNCVNPTHVCWETHDENIARSVPYGRWKGKVLPKDQPRDARGLFLPLKKP